MPRREAFAAWDDGDFERALELLQEAVGEAGDPDRRDALRAVMVGLFTELGADHPLAREHRRRLAAALATSGSRAGADPAGSSLTRELAG